MNERFNEQLCNAASRNSARLPLAAQRCTTSVQTGDPLITTRPISVRAAVSHNISTSRRGKSDTRLKGYDLTSCIALNDPQRLGLSTGARDLPDDAVTATTGPAA